MSKKTIIVLAVFALVLLGVGLFFFRKKEEPVSEEVEQPSEDIVQEEVVQVPVDDACIDLL